MNATRKATNVIDIRSRATVSIDTLAAALDCGQATARKIGEESGAKIQLGRRILHSTDKILAYLDKMAE